MLRGSRPWLMLLWGATLLAGSAHASPIGFVPVRSAGNAADPATGYGAVGSDYWIGVTEVTNGHYATFLNAKAKTDPHGLYDPAMGSDNLNGGIERSGPSASYDYTVKPGFENKPVTYVSFWDTLRFANWMNNGMGAGSTESGAYTLTLESIAANTVTRNAGASVFLPNEDEWYKAAYFDPVSANYFAYPAGADAQTSCAAPGTTANTANCFWWSTPSAVIDVGSYTESSSPAGTSDQGGNVREWIETVASSSPGALDERRLRGGDFEYNALELAAVQWTAAAPGQAVARTGFRVASVVPEPGTATLLALGLACGSAASRRRAKRRVSARA